MYEALREAPCLMMAREELPAGPPAEPIGFEDFFDAEHDSLFRALWLVTRNRHEAEDLMQDAFLRVWERWDRVGSLKDPVGYLYRTAMNGFRQSYRRAKLAVRRTAGLTPVDDGLAQVEARDEAIRAMATLSRRQRAVVVLTDLLGYRSDETAQILGLRPSTVRMHLSRAHAALKKTMIEAT